MIRAAALVVNISQHLYTRKKRVFFQRERERESEWVREREREREIMRQRSALISVQSPRRTEGIDISTHIGALISAHWYRRSHPEGRRADCADVGLAHAPLCEGGRGGGDSGLVWCRETEERFLFSLSVNLYLYLYLYKHININSFMNIAFDLSLYLFLVTQYMYGTP